jgi:hypothetical protein
MTIQPGNLTLGLFGHPLIRSLQTRRVRPRTDGTVRNPQYIPPKLFARALMDTLLPEAIPKGGESDDKNLLRDLDAAVTRLDDRFPAKRSLQALLRQAQGDVRRFESSLEDWYDAEMGRISGWYKRWSKLVLALIGLLIGIVANIDTIQIAHTLYVDEPVRQVLVAQATNGTQCQSVTDPAAQRQCVDTQIALLNSRGLPISYPSGCSFIRWSKLDNCWSWSAQPDSRGLAVALEIARMGANSIRRELWRSVLVRRPVEARIASYNRTQARGLIHRTGGTYDVRTTEVLRG